MGWIIRAKIMLLYHTHVSVDMICGNGNNSEMDNGIFWTCLMILLIFRSNVTWSD